jgi:hypothetical protein
VTLFHAEQFHCGTQLHSDSMKKSRTYSQAVDPKRRSRSHQHSSRFRDGTSPPCAYLSFLCTLVQLFAWPKVLDYQEVLEHEQSGGEMDLRARFLLLMVGLVSVSLLTGAASANPMALKCNSHRDQIWVYDSLNRFDVEAKLNCGENVEIIERVEGFLKIRAQNGVEGYIAETSVADLPALEVRQDPTRDVGLVAKQAQAKEIANATARAAADAAYINPPDSGRFAGPPSAGSANDASVPSTSSKNLPAGVSTLPVAGLAEMNPRRTAPPAGETSSREVAADSPAPTSDSNENSDLQPEKLSADVACQNYFAAYGLTPSQEKWIAQNRKKLFSNVCPAPDPSKVDFVIIFTHDVDFFSATMPEPVHKINGFSDFTPMTMIDSALMSESDADKAHRQYVWIFQFANGAFDPGSFSPRRQYQFSKMETSSLGSKAGIKTVEDAFQFLATSR